MYELEERQISWLFLTESHRKDFHLNPTAFKQQLTTYKAFKNNGVDALPFLGDEVHVSKELKGLIGAMLAPDSKKRPSIKEIR